MANIRQGAFNKLWLLPILILGLQCGAASQDVLPHPCDAVKCPPLTDMVCPEDSSVRETLNPIDLLQASTAAPVPESYNTSELAEDVYVECCLTKKCLCKTCYIPHCDGEGEVIVELQPETMDTPGRCCGVYECQREPNCTALHDTDTYWLAACQRCRCKSGTRICHQICDEGMTGKKPTAMCNSKSLNKFFEHGESWRDGCYECECVNGEENCVTPFCKSINCQPERQVMLKDSCCPVCWPSGIPMPHEEYQPHKPPTDDYDDADDEDDGNIAPVGHMEVDPLPHPPAYSAENEIDATPNTKLDNEPTSSTAAPTTVSTVNLTEGVIGTAVVLPTTVAPSATNGCNMEAGGARQDTPASYQVYPEVVEVVRQMHHNDLLYIIIGALVVGVLVLFAWNVQLRAKQRSYRPVSNFDDNFNKMTCKKTNDYV